jgi:hypothetical protein
VFSRRFVAGPKAVLTTPADREQTLRALRKRIVPAFADENLAASYAAF